MTSSAQPTREATEVDRIAETYLDASLELSPTKATRIGALGFDDRLTDYSPAGVAARLDLDRKTLRELDGVQCVDTVDETTVAAMRDRLGVAVEISLAGLEDSDLNIIASPAQDVRSVFDLMATSTGQDWDLVLARLRAVPSALAGYAESLVVAAGRGDIAPRRQVEGVAAQCEAYAKADGFFVEFARSAGDASLSDAQQAEVLAAAEAAGAAYGSLGDTLREQLLPSAPVSDAAGRERYALLSRAFVGAEVDLDEAYAWGQEELARITGQMLTEADQIRPGATVAEAMALLDEDPDQQLTGKDALLSWMQERADEAVSQLDGTHFDIPEPLRRIECRIAPTAEGGIYYTSPSDDFSRPGRMWWSVPVGVDDFTTWRELTTVYHEGVPGHHLQVGQSVYNRAQLNRWRRLDCWVSGHGEGWALYAEKLMDDLGYLDEPGARLGMLDGQSLRAARVVLDIGVHLGLPAPAEVGGGDWNYDKCWAFLRAHSAMAEEFLRFELDRYLGWPGQAPSYKLGERLWLAVRAEAEARPGFDLKDFHRQALNLGSVPLDVLRTAVLGSAS